MTTPEPTVLKLISAGAARGLVAALQERFCAETGARVDGRFGAVGAMKEALLGGAACDAMVLTEPLIDALVASGHLRAAPRAPLGRVRTGVAVRRGDSLPALGTADALRAALRAADRIYFPDPERSTAGIHFAAVLRKLGIDAELAPRIATFPNGATAMRALAASADSRPIGCTQITEIGDTDGVQLVGALPREFELATVYAAAVGATAADRETAARFVALLTGAESAALRIERGFELEPALR